VVAVVVIFRLAQTLLEALEAVAMEEHPRLLEEQILAVVAVLDINHLMLLVRQAVLAWSSSKCQIPLLQPSQVV
jgi:hypothetical protein